MWERASGRDYVFYIAYIVFRSSVAVISTSKERQRWTKHTFLFL